jgi:hypothetical protein
MDFETILKDAGYNLYKVCSCGGTKTYKFRFSTNKDIEIHVKPKIKRFSKFQKGRVQLSNNLLNLQEYV